MTTGTKYYNDKKRILFDQRNNALEYVIMCIISELLDKLIDDGFNIDKSKYSGYLESCGLEACACCLASLGVDFSYYEKLSLQVGDIIGIFLNNQSNFNKYNITHGTKPANRILSNYIIAVKTLFNVDAELKTYRTFNDIVNYVNNGNAVQICLNKPKHQLAVVAQQDNLYLLYCDSWPTRKGLQNKGYLELLTEDDYTKNVIQTCIVYKKLSE